MVLITGSNLDRLLLLFPTAKSIQQGRGEVSGTVARSTNSNEKKLSPRQIMIMVFMNEDCFSCVTSLLLLRFYLE